MHVLYTLPCFVVFIRKITGTAEYIGLSSRISLFYINACFVYFTLFCSFIRKINNTNTNENGIFLHIIHAIIRGYMYRLCEVAYTNPTPPLKILFYIPPTPIRESRWALLSHSYAIDSGAARICQRGPGQSDRAGGGCLIPPSHGREIFC